MREQWNQLRTEAKLSIVIMPLVIAVLTTVALPQAVGWFKDDGPELVIAATVPEDGWRSDHERNGKSVKRRKPRLTLTVVNRGTQQMCIITGAVVTGRTLSGHAAMRLRVGGRGRSAD